MSHAGVDEKNYMSHIPALARRKRSGESQWFAQNRALKMDSKRKDGQKKPLYDSTDMIH